MLVDSHAHLDNEAFAPDLPDVLKRARDAGVGRIVTIGTDLESSRRAQALAEAHGDVWFSPGIHPHDADKPADTAALRELARHPRAVAVGETGLDTVKNYASLPNQKELFVKHLEVALDADKPVTIHCREAHAALFPILRAHAPLRGVIHCFSGSWADAELYLGLNFYLSIAGPVTYPSAKELRETVQRIPLDNLLIETDCPFLPPQKFRGQRNEPAHVRYAAEEIAAVQGVPLEVVLETTSRNARNLFGLE
ncbi:MAG TPA: TatD family hydrolase [Planctomycetota bacterium]|nr:TatD family hydrolase [Planctomycetota bacterium]